MCRIVHNVANGDVPVHKHTVEGTPLIALPSHLIKAHTTQDEALEWFMPMGDTHSNTFANICRSFVLTTYVSTT
jgi:hypothetical protein